jgi:methyltransferase-like protein/2-polyprenyl-3-methyl-5-hydroxy-6-metoxy-1,4-benzoquinol methylase
MAEFQKLSSKFSIFSFFQRRAFLPVPGRFNLPRWVHLAMSHPVQSEYDAVAYPGGLFPQTHPERLATAATLFGLDPVPVGKCRVLELGCGDGANITAMAFSLPESRFLGIDLAKEPIRKGNEFIGRLGLKNIELRQMDVLQIPDDLGTFDYIITHGVYSWVPAEVREKIMAICGRHLSERGLAYISYNAYPGSHLRDVVRWMMRFHSQQFDDPAEKVRQARALVKFAAEASSRPGTWQDILKQQTERIGKYQANALYHDDLSGINQPFYFMEFMEHAARHGLQYLAEADLPDMLDDGLEKAAVDTLRQFSTDAFIVREQYLDFFKGRSFRQTVLCRQGLKVDRSLSPERAMPLLVAGEIRPVKADADLSADGLVDFQGPHEAVMATGDPVAKAALAHLGAIFPLSIPFEDLLKIARQQAGKDAGTADDRKELAEFIMRTHARGFVELHSHQPHFVTQISDRPTASRLARLEIQTGHHVSTLRHRTLRIDDSLGRHLLGLLDGTRDLAALAEELTEAVRSGAASLPGKETAAGPVEAPQILPEQARSNIQALANSAILVG